MTTENKIILGVVGLTVAIIAGIVLLGGNSAPPPIEATQVEKGELIRDTSIRRGPDSAKVKIVEFLDFQCPACKNAHPVIKEVLAVKGDSVQLVIRHFPLSSIHANADAAARAVEAAAIQNKVWEMHDQLFANQSQWATASRPKDSFMRYATDIGLNVEQFSRDYDDQKGVDRIKQDKGDGNALQVNSTPTIFIGGERYSGEVTKEAIIERISQLGG